MDYTVAIRTLGKAGDKYQKLLNSLAKQTIPPKSINVYIAEGYEIPKETIGVEKYIYVKKGMVAQRALLYPEVKTEYMLFLDDDVYLPPNAVEMLYKSLMAQNADVISPDVFPNAERSFCGRLLMAISGRMLSRKDDGIWAYKVMRNSGYSYNRNPQSGCYLSQTNAGPCFFCSKENFLKIKFEEELWIDQLTYALGDDQVMFYKMYKRGLKVLTIFGSGIEHLDAGTARKSEEKEQRIIYSDFFFKTIFWHRFIYKPETSLFLGMWNIICISYTLFFTLFISLIKIQRKIFCLKFLAIKNAFSYLKSEAYCNLPKI